MKHRKRYRIRPSALFIAIAIVLLIGISAYGLITHQNPLQSLLPDFKKAATPEEMVQQYFDGIKTEDYEPLYDMLTAESQALISREEFIAKHKNIYNGIEAKNLTITISEVSKEKGQILVSYSTKMDTTAGEIWDKSRIAFSPDQNSGGYLMEWTPKAIFSALTWSDKVRVNVLQAKRGEIFDVNGRMLAGQGTASSIGLVPGKMQGGLAWADALAEEGEDPLEEKPLSAAEITVRQDADIAQIAELLEMSPESVKKKLSASWVKDSSFVPLKTVSLHEQELKNAALEIPGVMVADVSLRSYPLAEKASHLIGYIQNINAEELSELSDKGYHANSVLGKAGLERIYEDHLRAKDGREILIVDGYGEEKKLLARIEKVDGKDLSLTIDAEMQSKLYDQFAQDKSCSVAINPKTGAVLALVSTPTYDANDFVMGMSTNKWQSLNEDENKPMYNRFKAAQCPGSTMKGITAAIGLNTGTISPGDDFGHSGLKWRKDGSWGGYSITTLKEYDGPANIENALVYSDNIFFGKAAMKIGGDTFAQELKRIGFEERIPFEYALYSSIFSNTEGFSSEIQLADSGFGQGQMLINPIHLAMIYAAFVNEGHILRPQLINSQFSRDIWIEQAFTPETAAVLKKDLIQVIERGTGSEARIPGKTLAGKTGTAEIKLSKEDSSGSELGWFVLFTAEENVENPLLVVTMVEDVKYRGGSHYVVNKLKTVFQ